MTVYMEAWLVSQSENGHEVERRPEMDLVAADPGAAVKAMTMANALALDPCDDILVYTVYDPDVVCGVDDRKLAAPLPCKNCGKDPVWVQLPIGASIACENWRCDGNTVTARTMAEAVLEWNRKQRDEDEQ